MENNLIIEEFIGTLTPHSRYNVVKIGFGGNYVYRHTNKKQIRLHVLVGLCVAKKLNWKNGDYINVTPFNNYLLLEKIDQTIEDDSEYKMFKGFKFKKIRNSLSYDISMNFNFLRPPNNKKIRTGNHEIIIVNEEPSLKVFLDSIYEENEKTEGEK